MASQEDQEDVRGHDNMDVVVSMVEADDWRRLLLSVCDEQAERCSLTVATQTEPCGISDSVYVSQFGECYHRDCQCHGLRNASRVYERRTRQICD